MSTVSNTCSLGALRFPRTCVYESYASARPCSTTTPYAIQPATLNPSRWLLRTKDVCYHGEGVMSANSTSCWFTLHVHGLIWLTTTPPSRTSSVVLVPVTQKTLGPKICSLRILISSLLTDSSGRSMPSRVSKSLPRFCSVTLPTNREVHLRTGVSPFCRRP